MLHKMSFYYDTRKKKGTFNIIVIVKNLIFQSVQRLFLKNIHRFYIFNIVLDLSHVSLKKRNTSLEFLCVVQTNLEREFFIIEKNIQIQKITVCSRQFHISSCLITVMTIYIHSDE